MTDDDRLSMPTDMRLDVERREESAARLRREEGLRRGRLVARVATLELREVPAGEREGIGLYVGGDRLDRDEVAELIGVAGEWLDTVRPEWRQ